MFSELSKPLTQSISLRHFNLPLCLRELLKCMDQNSISLTTTEVGLSSLDTLYWTCKLIIKLETWPLLRYSMEPIVSPLLGHGSLSLSTCISEKINPYSKRILRLRNLWVKSNTDEGKRCIGSGEHHRGYNCVCSLTFVIDATTQVILSHGRFLFLNE